MLYLSFIFFFKQKTAYEMRISDWSSDVCSSDLVASFGNDEFEKPYGIWVNRTGNGYEVYVTDAYMAGEDAQGEDILPPLAQLDRRVHRFAVSPSGDGLAVRSLGAFGGTSTEERRVGKEVVSTLRSRGSPYH